jgi:hypothetical protein
MKKKDRKNSVNFFLIIGNQNNPPDAILRNGDAIEIKKYKNLIMILR